MNEPEDTGPNWFRDLEEIAVELESEVDMHGPTHVQLIDLVRGVKDERDRLRADLYRERQVKRINDQALLEAVAERDRLRAVVDAALEWQRQMADLACAVDVLHVADLYRILAGPALDRAEPTDG